jgi:hypothetical protein
MPKTIGPADLATAIERAVASMKQTPPPAIVGFVTQSAPPKAPGLRDVGKSQIVVRLVA